MFESLLIYKFTYDPYRVSNNRELNLMKIIHLRPKPGSKNTQNK